LYFRDKTLLSPYQKGSYVIPKQEGHQLVPDYLVALVSFFHPPAFSTKPAIRLKLMASSSQLTNISYGKSYYFMYEMSIHEKKY